MRSRGPGEGRMPPEHEVDVVRLDAFCLPEDGSAVRPILTVVTDRRTRMVVEAAVFLPPSGGPTAA